MSWIGKKAADIVVSGQQLANGTVTAIKLAAGAVVAHLGYTPVNKAGDTMTGGLQLGGDAFGNTLRQLTVREDATDSTFKGVKVVNAGGSGAVAGVVFQAYDWVQGGVWHGRGATGTNRDGALVLGTNPNTSDLSEGGLVGRILIDNAGRVKLPYQPAFAARRGATQASGGGAYVITYQATQVNTGGHLNAGTGIFTAPVTGNYLFSFACLGPSATTTSFDIYGYKNGAIDSADFALRPQSQNGNDTLSTLSSGAFIVPLAAGDTFGLQVQQNISLYSDGNNWVHFSGWLLG